MAAKVTVKSVDDFYDCSSVIQFDVLNELHFGTGNCFITWEELFNSKFKFITNDSITIFIDLCVLSRTC